MKLLIKVVYLVPFLHVLRYLIYLPSFVLHELFFHHAFLLFSIKRHVVVDILIAHQELVLVRGVAVVEYWFCGTFGLKGFSNWLDVWHHLNPLEHRWLNEVTRFVTDETHVNVSRHVLRVIWSRFVHVILFNSLILGWIVAVLNLAWVTDTGWNVRFSAIIKLFLELLYEFVNYLIFLH